MSSKKQYTKSGAQRSPWSVFRKPHFFYTFFVILILSNYRKWMGKNWSLTSLHSSFSVSFLWTRKLRLFKEKASNMWIQEEIAGFEFQYKSSNFPPSCPDYPWCNYESELLSINLSNGAPLRDGNICVTVLSSWCVRLPSSNDTTIFGGKNRIALIDNLTEISVLDFEEIGNPEKNVREQVHLSTVKPVLSGHPRGML